MPCASGTTSTAARVSCKIFGPFTLILVTTTASLGSVASNNRDGTNRLSDPNKRASRSKSWEEDPFGRADRLLPQGSATEVQSLMGPSFARRVKTRNSKEQGRKALLFCLPTAACQTSSRSSAG